MKEGILTVPRRWLGLFPQTRSADAMKKAATQIPASAIAENTRAIDTQGLFVLGAARSGTTVLHLAAGRSRKDDLALLLTLGADKTARDNNARLPADRVPRSHPELRDLLRA